MSKVIVTIELDVKPEDADVRVLELARRALEEKVGDGIKITTMFVS